MDNFKIFVGAQTYGGPILDDMGYKAPDDMNHDQANIRYCAAPLVLFYVNKSGHLMPIAIQINQEPGPENPIWTPQEPNEHDCMLAKDNFGLCCRIKFPSGIYNVFMLSMRLYIETLVLLYHASY